MSATHAPPGSTDALNDMWRRQALWWHGIFALILLLTALLIVVELDDGSRIALAVGGLVVVAILYAVFGTRALGQCGLAWTLGYLIPAWAITLGVVLIADQAFTLLIALFPQTWAMLQRISYCITASLIAVTGIGLVQLAGEDFAAEAVLPILIGSIVTLGLTTILGLFIHRLVTEAEKRAEVIDELHRTRAELAAAERSEGVYAERERISREIHDTLAQGFTSVVTLSRAMRAALERGDVDAARQRLDLIEHTAAENLSEARLIVAEMSPGHLRSRTLPEALGRLVDAVSRESGIPGTLEVTGEPGTLLANAEILLLRTAQEALSNVRRHSGASSYAVCLAYAEGGVALTVTDDGCGFDPAESSRGFGLDGAAARAADLDAALSVESAPTEGTIVKVSVPA